MQGSDAQRIVVVGAGICGLTMAHLLAKAGRSVVLLEKLPTVGGLARSFSYGDYTFDIGPHRFHTANQQVGAYIKEIMGDEGITFPRRSMVYFMGSYYPWPVSPRSLIQFPPRLAASIGLDLAVNGLRHWDGESFETYILRQYGPTLYRHFFVEYSEKFLKIHPRDTHADWAKAGINRAIIDDKVKMNNLFELARSTLAGAAREDLHFLYPKTGMQRWSDLAAAAFLREGGRLLTGVEGIRLHLEGQQVKEVEAGGERFPIDQIIWTGELHSLCEQVGLPRPSLEYLNLVMYNVEVKAQLDPAFQWCYFGAKDLIFNRISNSVNFSRFLAPWGCSGLEVEVTCMPGEAVWTHPERYQDQVIQDLIKVGLLERKQHLRQVHIEHVSEAYPVYSLGYREALKQTTGSLKRISNLILAGRTAQFWYNNMDHSIGRALAVVNRFLGKESRVEGADFGREGEED